MKKLFALLVVALFTVSLAACGGSVPKKGDAMPTEMPATAPAEMPTTAPMEVPTTAPADGEDEEKEEGEEKDGEGAEAPKKKSLKKFEGNKMERAGDDEDE